jgi:ABC-type multidrug transport system ATPase subunit
VTSVLSINNLSKNYGSVQALQNVSFEVPAGSIFGILGPNGSGKTTLLGIVMDVLKATSGTFRWNSTTHNDAMRKQIGTLLETPNFYHYLSAVDNLKIAAKIKGRGEDDIDNVLQIVNLHQRKNSKFNTFSLGMKQRLAIASALLGNPSILVFDEPTNGLDPAGIAEIRELIKELSQKGKTIIMASHILDEVEKVCTHVAIIQKGVLKMVSSVKDVISDGGNQKYSNIFLISGDDANAIKNIALQLQGVVDVKIIGADVELYCTNTITAKQINQFYFSNNIVLSKIVEQKVSLEAKFLEITGIKSDR